MEQKTLTKLITKETGIEQESVQNTIKLLHEGATIPFISRYRKEMTGSLDEVQVGLVKDTLEKYEELIKRKETICKTIKEQGLFSEELNQQIDNCWVSSELEDIYLPYKPKKRTRATMAKEKGLEPLAKLIMRQKELNIEDRAAGFINDDVSSVDDALSGARDIIAEWITENKRARYAIRKLFSRDALIISKVNKKKAEEDEASKYLDYFEFRELLKKCPSHRLLAMRRGETEGFLKISIGPEQLDAEKALSDLFVSGVFAVSDQVEMACKDAYKRLLQPSMESEFKARAKEKADEEAIQVFAENLKQLLLAPPLGSKRVLAIDPGYRTGCKLVCLDEQGNLLCNETMYPHAPQNEKIKASKKLNTLVSMYKIDAIAIGNGTASRETEHLVKNTAFSKEIQVFVVSENGASVYSASSVAREEFPSYDVTVRGAVSIGRRLMDPLAELVKIDPKSIGVGQYQHDVDQSKLAKSLDAVVESCVNLVGVDLNMAGKHLLRYVSGLGLKSAENLVAYRKEIGRFTSREQLKKVKGIGAKAFEQSAGFLRIHEATNPLDDSAVHPESYLIVQAMAKDADCSIRELLKDSSKRKSILPEKYVSGSVGLPTLYDILKELEKPGRDPRKGIQVFEFDSSIKSMEDLIPGKVYPGIVSNITRFGAFVDIGVKQDGLVHVSQLADRFVSDPMEVVTLNQHVQVKVLQVDKERKRIQLSMKNV